MLLGFFACGTLMSCALFAPTVQDNDLKPYVKSFAKEIMTDNESLFWKKCSMMIVFLRNGETYQPWRQSLEQMKAILKGC